MKKLLIAMAFLWSVLGVAANKSQQTLGCERMIQGNLYPEVTNFLSPDQWSALLDNSLSEWWTSSSPAMYTPAKYTVGLGLLPPDINYGADAGVKIKSYKKPTSEFIQVESQDRVYTYELQKELGKKIPYAVKTTVRSVGSESLHEKTSQIGRSQGGHCYLKKQWRVDNNVPSLKFDINFCRKIRGMKYDLTKCSRQFAKVSRQWRRYKGRWAEQKAPKGKKVSNQDEMSDGKAAGIGAGPLYDLVSLIRACEVGLNVVNNGLTKNPANRSGQKSGRRTQIRQ